MSALTEGWNGIEGSIRQERYLDKIRESEVVLGLDHKGNVTILKSRFFPERVNKVLSINDTVDYFSHFVSHQCMKAVSGGNNLKMFQEGLSIEVRKIIEKYIEENNDG